jgi:hypothetical protein
VHNSLVHHAQRQVYFKESGCRLDWKQTRCASLALVEQEDWVACVKQLRQLSEDTTGLLHTLAKHAVPGVVGWRSLSCEALWGMLRPLLRVLLWVLPEHVPDAPATTTATGHGRKEQRVTTGAEYVLAVATVGKHHQVDDSSTLLPVTSTSTHLSVMPCRWMRVIPQLDAPFQIR